MSAINQYKHRELGFIECPSTFNFVYNNPTRKIAIYELLENIPDSESDFDGKVGDIILGGGSGEAPALRISIPEAFHFFIEDDFNGYESSSEILKAFWTPTESYCFCEGFMKIGWTPDIPIESWLAENICLLLIATIEKYSSYKIGLRSKSMLAFFKANQIERVSLTF